jgi:hypothetical protein
VHVFDHVVHHHSVEFMVAKSRVMQVAAKNRNSETLTSLGRCVFIHFLALDIPSSSPQLGEAMTVAATNLENPAGGQAA